jgi:alginate O-acetyltransferase complex protein AlgI
MSFISFHFAIFFPVVLGLYFALPYRFRHVFLLAASLYFYAVWRPPYVLQMVGAILVSYYAGLLIEKTTEQHKRKAVLLGALGLLLGNLFLFKYYNFLVESLAVVLGKLSLPNGIPTLDLLLPIGISFYTFQLVSYVVDVYQGKFHAERNVITFAVYLSFFPQLVAGPIERAKDLLPQFYRNVDFDYGRVAAGLQLMLWGCFKKVAIADRLGPFVEQVYGNPRGYDGVATVVATFFFACQVYCDFSGYSDIAIGAAQTMGFKLTTNFNRPYFATSIQDFWKRWHITLSSWLSEYVFTPLTRSRILRVKWYYMILISLFLTFVVSGIWHGAQWTFVLWGALHGTYLVASMLTQKIRSRSVKFLRLDTAPRLHHGLRVAFTFSLVLFSYILFRASSVQDAIHMASGLLTGWQGVLAGTNPLIFARPKEDVVLAMFGVAVVLAVELLQNFGSVRAMVAARPVWVRWSLYYAQTASLVFFGAFYNNAQQFIYFQF